MTYEQSKRLLQMEREDRLPFPSAVAIMDDKERRDLKRLQNLIEYFCVYKQPGQMVAMLELLADEDSVIRLSSEGINTDNVKNKIGEVFNSLPNVTNFCGKGVKGDPFRLTTIYGQGKFYRLGDSEIVKPIEEMLEVNHCYQNSRNIAKFCAPKMKSRQLTGISCVGSPYLHSVAEVTNEKGKSYVFDFNINLFMESSLYFKLFPMDILTEIDGENLLKNSEIIKRYAQFSAKNGEDIKFSHLALAYDDILEKAQSKFGEGFEEGRHDFWASI